MTKKSNELIVLARIKGAFGVTGEVRLATFTETPEACVAYGPLLDEGGVVVLTPAKHRPVKGGLAVRAPEVVTREDAEALRGVMLYVPRAALPEPDEDEFYYDDLVGMEVKSTDGKRVGAVIAVHDFGATPMIEIKPAKKDGHQAGSFFHPFTKQAVPKVDMNARRLIVEIVEPDSERDGGADAPPSEG